MMNLIRQFHFTRAERLGAAALLCVTAGLFIGPELYRQWYRPPAIDLSGLSEPASSVPAETPPGEDATEATPAGLFPFDPNTASVELLVRLGLAERVARTIVRYRERGGRFRVPDDLQKIYSLPAAEFERLQPYVRIAGAAPRAVAVHADHPAGPKSMAPEAFPFDPNAASPEELRRLGLPAALVQRLVHYREKGGYFFEKSDFRKLYGLADADYDRLEPLINIVKSGPVVRPAAYAGGRADRVPDTGPIDINSADLGAWQRLPGIGATRAAKIIRYRDKLGGFRAIEQVAETYDLPDSTFQQIKSRLALQTPVYRKINLNTARVDELDAHPYIDRKQAQLLVHYRDQHGPYATVAGIRQIAAFRDAAWLEKVTAYLEL